MTIRLNVCVEVYYCVKYNQLRIIANDYYQTLLNTTFVVFKTEAKVES